MMAERRADVVVQKSLQEGFGLTVAEAMWKSRPVVASRVGGIQDQIEHGMSGVLVDDPYDLDGFASAVRGVLNDRSCARRLGENARQRVHDHFLAPRILTQYAELGVRAHPDRRLNRARSSSTSRRKSQPVRWSLTRPKDCIAA